VLSEWINYTGCDSLFAAAADSFAAYFGGHERWSMNNNNCDAMGDGIVAPGMEGLDPATGSRATITRAARCAAELTASPGCACCPMAAELPTRR
jgi:hypothetical protein